MFKPKTLLKVVSILMIIFTAIGIITTIAGYAMLPKLEETAQSAGMDVSVLTEAYSPLNLAISAVSSICGLLAGIFGVSGKSYKGALVTMGIYTLILLISTVQSVMSIGFSAALIVSFILPILYWWGLYQSK